MKAQPDPIVMNKLLIREFLLEATPLLAPYGEIHVTSKEVKPYSWWKIHALADDLDTTAFIGRQRFDASLYPGYESRKPVNVYVALVVCGL
jgi:hypothetical protein